MFGLKKRDKSASTFAEGLEEPAAKTEPEKPKRKRGRPKKVYEAVPESEVQPVSEPVPLSEALKDHPAREHVESARFMVPPREFIPAKSMSGRGIQVNKSFDMKTAAIQFAEGKEPSRAEKDTLEIAGFQYKGPEGRKQWERTDQDRPGINIIDAMRLGTELADARREGPER